MTAIVIVLAGLTSNVIYRMFPWFSRPNIAPPPSRILHHLPLDHGHSSIHDDGRLIEVLCYLAITTVDQIFFFSL